MPTDKTTTESKQPLYKVLNEQKTGEKWEASGPSIWRGMDELATFRYQGTEANRSNAQYTALAVNNLHHLAELLEEILEESNRGTSGRLIVGKGLEAKIKEALTRIS